MERLKCLPLLLKVMLCDSLVCDFVDFLIFTCANDNYQYIIILADELVDDTQSGFAKLDFQKTGQVCIVLIPQEFSVAAFCFR